MHHSGPASYLEKFIHVNFHCCTYVSSLLTPIRRFPIVLPINPLSTNRTLGSLHSSDSKMQPCGGCKCPRGSRVSPRICEALEMEGVYGMIKTCGVAGSNACWFMLCCLIIPCYTTHKMQQIGKDDRPGAHLLIFKKSNLLICPTIALYALVGSDCSRRWGAIIQPQVAFPVTVLLGQLLACMKMTARGRDTSIH